MQIKSLDLKDFGKFNEERVDFIPAKLNVLYGKNEAGKTTLNMAMITLLYGFHPANREQFPYLPWGKDKAELIGQLDDGRLVKRKLMSAASGELIQGDRVEKINNHPLVKMPRPLYETMYKLTAEELIGIEEASWEEIKERLLTTYGPGIKKPKAVLDELQKQMDLIYKQRGRKHKLNALKEEKKNLKEEKRERLQWEADQDQHVQQWQELKSQLQALDKELEDSKAHYQLMQGLLTLKGLEEKQKAYEGRLHAPQALEKIPHQIETQFIEGQGKIRQTKAAIEEVNLERKVIEDKRHSFTGQEKLILEGKDQLKELQLLEQQYEDLVQESKNSEEALLKVEEAFQKEARYLYEEEDLHYGKEELRDLSIAHLKNALQEPVKASQPRGFYLMASLGFALVSILGLLSKTYLLSGVSILFMLTGLLAYVKAPRDKEKALSPLDHTHMSKATKDHFHAASLRSIEVCKDLLMKMDSIRPPKQEDFDQLKEKLARLKSTLMVESYDQGQEQYQRVKALEEKNQLYQDRLNELDKKLIMLEDRLNLDQDQFLETKKLLSLYDEDPNRAINLWKEDLATKNMLRANEEEILAINNVEKKKQALSAWSGPLDDHQILLLEERIEDLSNQVKTLSMEASKLEAILGQESHKRSLDRIDSDLTRVHEEERAAKEQYDQALFLYNLIKRVDQDYRDKHQPDFMKTASKYLEKMTKGQYNKLLSDDESGLYLSKGEELLSVDLSLSKGTKNQLYLALRLALLDQIEGGQETLPLLLDEALINFDQERSDMALDLLADLAKERQLIIFTCHETFAKRMMALEGVHLVEMT